MNLDLEGYVIYCKNTGKTIPIGVVSEGYECKAIANHVPDKFKSFLVEIEDKRFYKHKGIDYKGTTRALLENLKAKKIVQGGSTITQQLARNILNDNRQTLSRKLKEAVRAIQIENQYSKDEILDLYFNNVYFGKNLRGIRAAGLYYFGKEVVELNQSEILYLLAILRGPNYYATRPAAVKRRFQFISNTLYKRNLISQNRNSKNCRTALIVKDNHLQNINTKSAPYIIASTDLKNKRIISTLDIDIHKFAKQFVADSKYPVSIIALCKDKVVGFASSYGTDYPFVSKSNVGSTLKPFLYCYLREHGVSTIEKFNSCKNKLDWNVREVAYHKSQLTLEEALFYSNNNTFINAVTKMGLEDSLTFLSAVFNRSKDEFYPSSILGATRSGISLYELALAYSTFFAKNHLTETKVECLSVLNRIFVEKLGFNVENVFLKTGTTNDNRERFAVLGNPDLTFAILRNENAINDESKEGGFMNQISRSFSEFYKSQIKSHNNYKWL